MSGTPTGWQRWLWPLRSRKVQVAIATVVAAYAVQAGLDVHEETVLTVLGVGVALILGIAHEDAGAARASSEKEGEQAPVTPPAVPRS
jgi:hypothetical protein